MAKLDKLTTDTIKQMASHLRKRDKEFSDVKDELLNNLKALQVDMKSLDMKSLEKEFVKMAKKTKPDFNMKVEPVIDVKVEPIIKIDDIIKEIKQSIGDDASESFIDKLKEFSDVIKETGATDKGFGISNSDEAIDDFQTRIVDKTAILFGDQMDYNESHEETLINIMDAVVSSFKETVDIQKKASIENQPEDMKLFFMDISKDIHEDAIENFKNREMFLSAFKDNLNEGGKQLRTLLTDKRLLDDERDSIIEKYITELSNLNGLGFAQDDKFKRDIAKQINDMVDDFSGRNSIFGKMSQAIESFYETRVGRHIQIGFENTMSVLRSEWNNILGEIDTYFVAPILGLAKGLWGFIYDSESDDFETQQLSLSEESVSWMEKIHMGIQGMLVTDEEMLKNMEEARLLAQRQAAEGDTKGPFAKFLDEFGWVGVAVGALGLAIGAFVGMIWNQIKVWGGLVKLFGIVLSEIKSIGAAIKSVGTFFTGIGKMFGKIFKWLGNLVGSGSKFFSIAKKVLPFFDDIAKYFKLFFKAFKFGFAKWAWPLQILLSAIDLITGFMKSEADTFFGKFKDGVWNVIEKFVELPVKMFGWMIDKVLGWFGMEIEGGTASKIMEGIKKMFSIIFDIVIFPYKQFKVGFDIIKGLLGPAFAGFKTYAELMANGFNIVKEVFKAIGNLFSGDFEALFDNLGNIGDLMGNFKDILYEGFLKVFKKLGEIPGMFWEAVKDAGKNIPFVGKLFGDDDDEVEEEIIKKKKSAINTMLSSHGTDKKEVEVDASKDFLKTLTDKYVDQPTKRSTDKKGIDDDASKDFLKTLTDKYADQPTKSSTNKMLNKMVKVPKQLQVYFNGREEVTKKEWLIALNTIAPQQSDGIEMSTGADVRLGAESKGLDQSQAGVVKRQLEAVAGIKEGVVTSGDQISNHLIDQRQDFNETKTQSMEQDAVAIEPPIDIETLGVLFFNKSWGIT